MGKYKNSFLVTTILAPWSKGKDVTLSMSQCYVQFMPESSGDIAQLAEHTTVNRRVESSILSIPANQNF